MPLPGNLLTTAMAVMPHQDVDRALKAALSLDIPFWPQLPRLNYYEDMYVQASEHFPGAVLDMENQRLSFSYDKFLAELEEAYAHMAEPEYFDISPTYSAVYHQFLKLDLKDRPAIRGQLEGPISFGFNVKDQDDRPIIFDDNVRPFMLEFMAQRVNTQLRRLKQMNENAFMFVDEPGLQFVFSGVSGYGEAAARRDLETFFSYIERPRGVHLCGNPDWDFLLGLDLEVLSLDMYSNGERFVSYVKSIRRFLDRGGVIIWGMIPTQTENFAKQGLPELSARLINLWNTLDKAGIDRGFLLSRSLLSPATCCLINPDGERTVEAALAAVNRLSRDLRAELLGL
ncbi:MAG: hypothetical protein HY910_03420 [Desulfarculus sp.]|nr:hypothetical protein [Desulfarculus sp.]